ncbi:hypothetical protein D3C84_1086720 [compost metagenome]
MVPVLQTARFRASVVGHQYIHHRTRGQQRLSTGCGGQVGHHGAGQPPRAAQNVLRGLFQALGIAAIDQHIAALLRQCQRTGFAKSS